MKTKFKRKTHRNLSSLRENSLVLHGRLEILLERKVTQIKSLKETLCIYLCIYFYL